MVIILKQGITKEQVEKLKTNVEEMGVQVVPVEGQEINVLGLVGDTTRVNAEMVEADECVERVLRVQEPFKRANRMFKHDDTIVDVNGVKIGGGHFGLIAGPCSVETEEQIIEVAMAVKKSGATMLRGGAFKPRTSPYSFQGLKDRGLDLLLEAKKVTGLPIVTEIMSTEYLDRFVNDVDVIQVGARNMQNFDLLKELGHVNKPILLKRGLSATYEELLMSAEYIMAGGNDNVILCERGIRTFETYTRNTLDVAAIPVLKKLSHLPVIIDPSHSAGKSWLVDPLSKAAVAAGADGLIIEVHNNPAKALCDGQQSLRPDQFDKLASELKVMAAALGKNI